MESGPEDVSLLERCPQILCNRLQWSWDSLLERVVLISESATNSMY